MEDKSLPEATGDAGGQTDLSQTDAGKATADDTGADKGTAATTASDDTNDKGGDAGDGGEKSDKTPAKFDDDLDDWAEKRGYGKLETDRERKLAQDARNNQREFRSGDAAKKAAATMDKTIRDANPKTGGDDDDADPLEKDVAGLKADLQNERANRLRSEYFAEQSVTTQESEMMSAILKEKVDKASTPKAKEEVFNFLTDPANLADWHDMAKARLTKGADAVGEIEDKARADERERLAKVTASNGPNRSASSTITKGKSEEEARLERFSSGWRTSA